MRPFAYIALLSALSMNSAQAWWDVAWTERSELKFRASDINSNQNNMAILVTLDSSRIDYAQLQANGEDLRFVDGDDITELAYEIESWNPAGTSYVWVQVPQINANSTTDAIFIYWGNVAIGPGANSTATWPTDAEIVYHFDHAPPDDVITDTNSTNAGSTRVNGFIDKSRDFSGSTHFDTNISLDPWLGDTATMMFWMNTTDLGSSDPHDGNALTGDRKGSSPQKDIAWGWLDDSGHIGLVTGNDNASSTTAINDGDWHHVVIQRDGSSGQQRVFVDGVLEDVQSGSVGIILPDSPFDSIGQVNGTGGTSDFEIEATIDEFELYSSYQSAAWALAQYKSQTDTLIEWCPLFDFYADTDNDGYGNPDDTVQACVQPIGYTADASDCDDTAGAINPGANEICDPANIDEDCSGSADDDDASATGHTDWFLDIDSDTFGDPATGLASCDPPSGRIADNTDCDDTNANAYPNALWYVDSDGDGYGDSGNTVNSCLQPANTSLDDTDCDDSNAAINPATEWFADDDGDTYGDPTSSIVQCSAPPSGVLNSDDCDDNDSAVNPDTLWYIDDDGDNFGVSGPTLASCLQPDGYANNTDDCDDTNAAANPDAQWYVDNDNDGYGATGAFLTQCLQPSGYAGNNADCNDNDATLNPDTVWYHDSDGDLFGDPLDASNQCNQPNNHVSDNGDCDDANPAVNPNGTEVCGDGLDNDCDGTTDVGVGTGSTWYADADGDTYGDPGNTIIDCVAPDGYTADNQDCNDGDDTIFPGASEVCGDGFDSNCDGLGGPNGDDDGDGISYLDELAVGGWDCSGDTDGDTVPDAQEYLLGDTDGDGDFNINDFDDDNDGFPTEFEYENGANSDEFCPNPDTTPDYLDTDSDGDGLQDFDDGITDADADGILNYRDCDSSGCAGDQDSDGIGNCDELNLGTDGANADSDGDGVDDLTEVGGNPANPTAIDTDGDGIIDALDNDDDNDGVLTFDEDLNLDGDPTNDDWDNDNTPNYLDTDDDGDGILTWDEDANENGDYNDDDLDGDTHPDWLDDDDQDGPLSDPDQDGVSNADEEIAGTDPYSSDSDGDGISDATELGDGSNIDTDGDGDIDALDNDDDGDGLLTIDEGSGDLDGDGVPNYLDDDSDGDGILDIDEGVEDTDCDGIPDWADPEIDFSCDDVAGDGSQTIIREDCSCTSSPSSAQPWWLLLTVVAWRRRRNPL